MPLLFIVYGGFMGNYILSVVKRFVGQARKDMVFTGAALLAIITSFINTPKLSYIDFRVIGLLFNLIVIVSAFQELKLLDKIAISILNKCSNRRVLTCALILITFFASMLLTNDVALITLVPLTIIISKRSRINPMEIIILQTLAANIGSSLTPIGNPQNLFIYSYFNVNTFEFLKSGLAISVLGILALILFNFKTNKDKLQYTLENIIIEDKVKLYIYAVLFLFIFLSVFRVVDYKIVLIANILITLLVNPKLFRVVDYFLLATFISFFVVIGNISSIDYVKEVAKLMLNSETSTYLVSVLLSQIISNVPAAILISGFASSWRSVMLGVNIGGMGTLIASLASVIAYKFYIKEFGNGKEYLFKFHIYNFVGLLLLGALIYMFV